MTPLLKEVRRNPLLWVLAFVPAVFAAAKLKPEAHTLLFVLSVLAIAPLAALLSYATESVAAKTGDAAGGFSTPAGELDRTGHRAHRLARRRMHAGEVVVGDGRATVGALLRNGPWIAARAAARGAFAVDRLCDLPDAGERVPLFEIGFYSHDATFVDRCERCTATLEQRVEALSRAHPGFFFGRFDVCAASVDALQRGRFLVFELNGVVAEPIHIYDPAMGIAAAFRVLRRQWRDAFAIGAANRALGARIAPATELVRLFWRRSIGHFEDDAHILP